MKKRNSLLLIFLILICASSFEASATQDYLFYSYVGEELPQSNLKGVDNVGCYAKMGSITYMGARSANERDDRSFFAKLYEDGFSAIKALFGPKNNLEGEGSNRIIHDVVGPNPNHLLGWGYGFSDIHSAKPLQMGDWGRHDTLTLLDEPGGDEMVALLPINDSFGSTIIYRIDFSTGYFQAIKSFKSFKSMPAYVATYVGYCQAIEPMTTPPTNP